MIRIAFLTGRSDPRSCALSPLQRAFLARVSESWLLPVLINFPYCDGTADHRHQPLWLASVRNVRDYFASRQPAFAHRYAPSIARLIEDGDHTIFLTGSCGLELFLNARLPRPLLARCSVFAYGPVARERPDCRFFAVRGRDDWLSRRNFGEVDRIVEGGHLGYLLDEDVLHLCRAFIRSTPRRPDAATDSRPSRVR